MPWGYIPLGPLFGWENSQAHQCNNPYWASRNGPGMNAQPAVPRTDPARTSFSNHCYVVFNDHAGLTRVIDICHAISSPAGGILIQDGAHDVPNYRAQSIDIESRGTLYSSA